MCYTGCIRLQPRLASTSSHVSSWSSNASSLRNDVVRVARKNQTPLSQIAKDFSIGEQTLFGSMIIV
jgi:hypothetical protein